MAETPSETAPAPEQQQLPPAVTTETEHKPQDSVTNKASDSAAATSAAETKETLSSPEKAASPKPTPPASLDIDSNKPEDFTGEILTTNELPSVEIQKKIENYVVLDQHGKTHTFKSLYTGPNVARRVLVIFVRHFFCGNCQEYLRTLSEEIKTEELLRLPISTFITVIGCGDPALIDMYTKATGCPFPVYTDPTRSLFDALGMVKTLNLGTKPAYTKKSVAKGIFDSIGQALRFVPKGLALKSGDQRQVGGEFLFEPFDIVTPVTTPHDEREHQMGSLEGLGRGEDHAGDDRSEEKKVTWCHRMKTTRDHAEMPELREILGLDSREESATGGAAETKRKGTGLSMASQMSQLTQAAEPTEPAIRENE